MTQLHELSISEYLWLEFPTYDKLYSAHTAKSTHLCRHIIDGTIRILMDSVVRACEPSKPLASWDNTPVSRIEADIIDYLFDGYIAKAPA